MIWWFDNPKKKHTPLVRWHKIGVFSSTWSVPGRLAQVLSNSNSTRCAATGGPALEGLRFSPKFSTLTFSELENPHWMELHQLELSTYLPFLRGKSTISTTFSETPLVRKPEGKSWSPSHHGCFKKFSIRSPGMSWSSMAKNPSRARRSVWRWIPIGKNLRILRDTIYTIDR